MLDFFIGHTAEDESTASALANALREQQFDVIYENTVLHLGDSLPEDLRQFFAMARCGVLLLSHSFFNMLWSQWELDELVEMVEQQTNARLMTVLHGLDKGEVARYSPTLAQKVSISTAVGLTTVAEILAQMLNHNRAKSPLNQASAAQSLTLRSGHMPQLGDQLASQFSEAEMRDICFELGLSYSRLEGESKTEKANALLKELHRRGEVGTLMQLVRQLRPHVSWM